MTESLLGCSGRNWRPAKSRLALAARQVVSVPASSKYWTLHAAKWPTPCVAACLLRNGENIGGCCYCSAIYEARENLAVFYATRLWTSRTMPPEELILMLFEYQAALEAFFDRGR